MNRRIIISFVIVVLLLSGFLTFRNGLKITLSEKEIQDSVNNNFPMEKTHLKFFKIMYSNPIIELLDDSNRVRIGLTATPRILINGKLNAGTAVANGGFKYEPTTGNVFLTGFKIEKLAINQNTNISLDLISMALSAELEDYYSKHPIYTLSDTEFKQKTAKMVVKELKIHNKKVVITLGM